MRASFGAAATAMLLLGGCIPNMDYQPRQAPTPPEGSSQSGYPPHGGQARPTPPLPAPRTAPAPWDTSPVAPDAQYVPDSNYVVQPGDTLRGIAGKTGAGSEAIARANGLHSPFTVMVGQRLRIPGGRYHLVRQGQTGIAIARAYGVPWSQIVDANALTEPYILRAGQRIVIPGGASTRNDMTSTRPDARNDHGLQLIIDDIVTGGQPALGATAEPARPSPRPDRVPPPDVPVAAPTRLTSGFVWPVNGRIASRYGPNSAGGRNDGINIAVATGTPVKAAADGVVAYTGTGVAGLGGLVIIKHGDSWTTVYGNNDKLLVERGQSVKRGQTIALSGTSSVADKPELHFEIRKGRTPVDPLSTLPAR